jgi:uncharacterized repeat protein (TIGR02543 family)
MRSRSGRLAGRLRLPMMATVILLALPVTGASAASTTASADAQRTGWFPDEPGLSPQVIERGDFGKVFDTELEGQIYAQPLVIGDTVLVATEDNWIYGLDKRTGAIEWERDLGIPPWNPMDLGCEDLVPNVGITGTPVIDPATGVAYFTAKTYASGTSGPAIWKMYAVDVATGDDVAGFPVTIAGEAENLPGVSFNPTKELQRTALLLMDGDVYAGFAGHCDSRPYHGWIAGVSTSGQQKTLWASTPLDGGGIWQSGGGLASDGTGQILFATGNSFTSSPLTPTATPPEDLGNSVVRLQVGTSGEAEATDFFAPWNREELDEGDRDLGSGGVISLPSQYFGTEAVPHLLVDIGKQFYVFLLDRDNLGGFAQGPEGKNDIVEEVQITKGSFGSPAVWPGDGGYVYIPSNGTMAVLQYSEVLGVPHLSFVAEPAEHGNFGSGSPIVTSSGTASGSALVWIVNRCTASPGCHSTLRAYPAVPGGSTPQPLWSADVGVANKFNHPLSDEGRIYLGVEGHLLAFGALRHTLTVATPGGGTVSSSPAGIDCGATCSHTFDNETTVTLTAHPNEGYAFSGWSGGCTGTGACQVTMDRDLSVTANFTAAPPPSGGGGDAGGGGSAAANGSAGPGAAPPPPALLARPTGTKIVAAKILSRKGTARFTFKATGATGFECRLLKPGQRKKPAFARCASPKSYKRLARGSYVFEARGTNAAGKDPTPAKKRFKIAA